MNRLLQFFSYQHLPPHLALVAKPFADLAAKLDAQLPDNPEKTVALRKLLEAKDCAVRAVLFLEEELAP
jgi:ferritin-like protein